jgi:hypothetical protein
VRVHLVSLRPPGLAPTQLEQFQDLATLDRAGTHAVVDRPEDADLLLFVDVQFHGWQMRALLDHPLRKRYGERCFVFCDTDRPWCAMPGVYVSMPRGSFDWRWQRPWLYHRSPNVIERRPVQDADLLFSFVGGRNHAVRDGILALRHARSVVEDTTGFLFHRTDGPDHATRVHRFQEVLVRSKFVVCPRGHGTSSFRLNETLAAGRVPVIVSDEWVPPPELDWDTFSIRVPERGVHGLPALLEAREAEFEDLARRAAEAYDRQFAPEATFTRVVDLCAEIAGSEPRAAFSRDRRRYLRWGRLWAAEQVGRLRHPTTAARGT